MPTFYEYENLDAVVIETRAKKLAREREKTRDQDIEKLHCVEIKLCTGHTVKECTLKPLTQKQIQDIQDNHRKRLTHVKKPWENQTNVVKNR